MNCRPSGISFAVRVLVLAFATTLLAQVPMMGNLNISEKMQENAKKLKQYAYTLKTEVFLKNELRGSKLARVHYDPVTGEKVVTPLDSASTQTQQAADGGRRGMLAKVKEKKKIALPNYLKQGDKFVMSIDPSTKALSDIVVNSSLDTDPVSFHVVFSQLPDGTNYASLTNIDSPAKELRIQVSTSDYHK